MRGTRLPEEVKGFMQLVQPRVLVNVVGTDTVGTFEAEVGGYIVVHKEDMKEFVKATQEHQKCRVGDGQ